MKKVFLGLLVAGVALAGSAFTNAKTLSQVYITGLSGTTYTYNSTVRPCEGAAKPCLVEAVGTYTFPISGIPTADLNNPLKVKILSHQDSF